MYTLFCILFKKISLYINKGNLSLKKKEKRKCFLLFSFVKLIFIDINNNGKSIFFI